MNDELLNRVSKLERELNALKSSSTIPFEVDRAFRDRFRDILVLNVSSKNASSEDQAVDEGGISTYAVLGDPDGFLEVIIAGTPYYLPYYD
jgi:hypothetical protein